MKGKVEWGKIVIINLYGCKKELLKDKQYLKDFAKLVCKEIGMKPHWEAMVEGFWKWNLKWNSMLQFIETSSISVHLDEVWNRAFIDIFSCQEFDDRKAKRFCENYFRSLQARSKTMYR